MKVLLTGANGFVGSHIVDNLRARGVATSVLLRPGGNRAFIAAQLRALDVREGSIGDPRSLDAAMGDATHVIHCAGLTRAVRTGEFYKANGAGTRQVVDAVNRRQGGIRRLIYISSLAAGGPAGPGNPARESDPPGPVSEYGKSKLAGEQEVRGACSSDAVILRPPAVYGPRDAAFLPLFKAVKAHLLPLFGGGSMPLSLVYVKDLAEAAVSCLTHPAAPGRTFYVASPEVTTSHGLAGAIASQLKTWTLPVPLPVAALWPVCAFQDAASRLTGRPGILSLQKYPELRARGWVCDPAQIRRELGFTCPTDLATGIAETLSWYRQAAWL